MRSTHPLAGAGAGGASSWLATVRMPRSFATSDELGVGVKELQLDHVSLARDISFCYLVCVEVMPSINSSRSIAAISSLFEIVSSMRVHLNRTEPLFG